jgi:hypothetical protein
MSNRVQTVPAWHSALQQRLSLLIGPLHPSAEEAGNQPAQAQQTSQAPTNATASIAAAGLQLLATLSLVPVPRRPIPVNP